MRTDYSIDEEWDYGHEILVRGTEPCVITIPINIEKEARHYRNLVANRGPFREIDTTGTD